MKYQGVSAVERSENSKIGTVSATYVSQRSCPGDCALANGSGCYAEYGNVGMQTARLNRDAAAAKRTVLQLAKDEARAIRQLSGQLPLRLHVVGDATTDQAAAALAAAAADYSARQQQPVWTYTHAWRRVRRESWGKVSVLASCERTKDVRSARRKGYATALVVAKFRQQTAYVQDGVKLIPCPQQTGRAQSCEKCRLCWRADRLRAIGATIAFEVHGSGAKRAAQQLVQIQAAQQAGSKSAGRRKDDDEAK